MFKEIIIDQFLDEVIKYPQNNAFCINNAFYSYSEFTKRVVAIARSIQNCPEVNIALIANDDLDTYASIFAIWANGKSYVPLNPETPKERNRNVINQVGIKTILDSKSTAKLKSQDLNLSIQWLKEQTGSIDFDNQIAYIFFTSGSTGTPKGVTISKNNVASFVEAFWALGYNIDETDRVLQMFELTFDLSVMSYLIPLLKGSCVYTIPKGKIKYSYIFELMEDHELTVALMVPSMLNYLRPYFEEIRCPKMKYSLFCGEALQEQILSEWAECLPNAQIDNVYGPTEDTIFCTRYTYNRNGENDSHNGVLSIGTSMRNNLAVVFDEKNTQCRYNEVGELCLAGAQLTPGYFNKPELNRDMFFHLNYNGDDTRFYRTGDLCLLKKNGNIEYIGRKDSQVKIQGFRIELSEVEFHTKNAIKGTVPLVALALKNVTGNFEIAIVFESPEFEISGIKQYLNSKMPSYMVPSRYSFIKQFPLNTNGKTDRKKIEEIMAV
ncbi:amino acid adenylation domain-containing protein [uncultured Draconibacterium sp.]|uniref:amino acid adenylation domain-containing protein n=1 Tax=uncultured Draconibacterium sp. TaxID=1573823 RepID=UPI0029C6F73B|nr:amino acid adenylation domain-containing protein [uncultured Draconibacterium sp.]